jgi:hypothetical protein
MRIILATVIVVGVLCGVPAWADAPVGKGKVYSGSEGESVAVIPVTTKNAQGKKQALLQIQGTDSDFDDKALMAWIDDAGRGVNYVTQYKGEDYHTLVVREAYGSKSYELYVPGRLESFKVSYDEKRTEALKSADAWALYQKLTKDGTLGRMAAYNRKERETGHNQGLAEELKSLNEACGTKVTASIDWKSVSDDVIKAYSISSYCANPLSALRRLCESPAGKKAIQAKVKKLSCQFGPEMKVDIKDGTVSWTTATDAGNQEEFATKFFEKNL